MKLSILPLAVAGAGLLASASPMRVIIVSSSVQAVDGPVAQIHPPVALAPMKQHAPCAGRLRQKAEGLSKSLMAALGFSSSHVEVQPLPFIGTPNGNGLEGTTRGGDRVRIMPMAAHPHPERIHAHVHHEHGHGHGRFHHLKKDDHSFLMRVHFALMSLGPWEGRAVAFVLGCGIGVLLRMLFVLTVISYRLIRGQRSSPANDEHEYTVVEFDFADAEEIFVAPPQYTYPTDEKVAPKPEPIPVPVASSDDN
ncbi:hypothetical protein FB45DRAFT_933054 [Roridomyces roridus]|uniref:Uncharacterized protein n=1 Tax=Roridomyces roridus TaxID=1738132 RepID=A0AAD7BDR9_9AGAR|nr:hypothetical protein FB45DRAFT_933054 [Roridomyces roridus]